jgi:hypothetical protein
MQRLPIVLVVEVSSELYEGFKKGAKAVNIRWSSEYEAGLLRSSWS